ncbi:MAG: DUF6290 family protein [Terrisporobacter sp.]
MGYLKNLCNILEEQLIGQEKQIKEKEIEFGEATSRSKRIEWRVSEEEKELIKLMAKLQRMDVSEFLRYIIFNKYSDELLKLNK